MRSRTGTVSAGEPDLPLVVKELAEALLADDWYRMSTEGGDRRYYVVRASDQAADSAEFSRMDVPTPTRRGPLSEWMVRSQLADHKPDAHLANSRKGLEKAGI